MQAAVEHAVPLGPRKAWNGMQNVPSDTHVLIAAYKRIVPLSV
jgi:hypothetical protein